MVKWHWVFGCFLGVMLAFNVYASDHYSVLPDQSTISFSVFHFADGHVTGRFYGFEGDIEWDPVKKQLLSVSGNIQVNSLKTDNKIRDRHLKSRVFFNAKTHPLIRFKSTTLRATNRGLTVTGNIEIKGHTQVIALQPTVTEKDEQLFITLSTTLNRHKFGISPYRRLINADIHVNLIIVAQIQ